MIKTWFQKPKLPIGQTRKGIKLTVPDQNLTVKEIISRYASGRSLPQSRVPQYSNEDWDKYQKMDKIEKIDSLKNVNEYINEIKNSPPPDDKGTKASERPSIEGASEQSDQSKVGEKSTNQS